MAHLSVQAFQGPTRLRIDFIEKNCLTIPAVWFVQAEVSSCYHLRRSLAAVGQSCRCYAPQLGRDGPKQQFPQRLSGVPSHTCLLRRRLEHVEHMLRDTHAPLSGIALATGFSRPKPSRAARPAVGRNVPAPGPVEQKGTSPQDVTLCEKVT
jgi:hypothetical protein